MKTIGSLILLLSCLLDGYQATAQTTAAQPNSAAKWFSEFGFEKLPELVKWIRQLDTEWDKLVQDEQRTQMLRQLKQIASATAELKLHCDKAASFLETGADVIPEIKALESTVSDLRLRMTDLSTELGGDVGEDGVAIAKQFDNIMATRAGKLSYARKRLEQNQPGDKAAASEYLMEAATLAQNAHEALVIFVNHHAPKK